MSGADDAAAAPPAKADPETLVLRGRLRPVVRFRRGLIIGLAGAVAACLVGVTWLALEPPSLRMAAEQEPGEPATGGAPEVLADAPAGYGDVPRLGPPLPGDLGGPILEHRRSLEAAAESAAPDPGAAAERAQAERQRLAAAEQAARASDVLVQLSGSGRDDVSPETGVGGSGGAGETFAPLQMADAGAQRRKIAFAGSGDGDANPHPLLQAPSPWTLSAGTVIPASLISGLNSDLPGLVIAQVTAPVYDSSTGGTMLIPQGAKLIGRYDNVVGFGQRRALLVWERLVLPDGSSIRLDSMPATDLAGYAGLEDEVDFHSWRLLKGIALSTLLGVGTELGLGSGESDLVRAIRESAQRNAARAGERITERNLDVQPTLTVRPGWPVRAVIHKDLVLRPWQG